MNEDLKQRLIFFLTSVIDMEQQADLDDENEDTLESEAESLLEQIIDL